MVQVPKRDWEEVMATIETLRDKEVLKGIEKSRKEIREGKFLTLDELEKELRELEKKDQ